MNPYDRKCDRCSHIIQEHSKRAIWGREIVCSSCYEEKEIVKMKYLRQQVEDLGDEIVGDLHHGECFYEIEMLLKFHVKLDEMKELSTKYYLENKAEMENE